MTASNVLSAGALTDYVAALMDIPPRDLFPDASLLEAGLDSISIMRIAAYFKSFGHSVKFDDLIATPTIGAWIRLAGRGEDARPARSGQGDAAAADGIAQDDGEAFDLTPVQQAYWFGRRDDQPLGGVGCHLYLELDGEGVDPSRLDQAVKRLAIRHPMLRARFLDDGRQRIGDAGPGVALTVHDFSRRPDGGAGALAELRDRLSHRRLAVADGEPFSVQLSLLPGGRSRLHFDIDLLVADVLSVSIVLGDLAAIYDGREDDLPPLAFDFRQYLARIRSERAADSDMARRYWSERLPSLPGGPRLPLRRDPQERVAPRFVRRQFHLASADIDRIRAQARRHGVTLACVLATAYGEVLARWAGEPRFLINIPLFDRQEIDPAVRHMVADFTNLVLLEVDFSTAAGFADRVRGIQAQLHRDIAQSDHSGVEVLRDLARHDQGGGRTAPVVFACNLGAPFVPQEAVEAFGQVSWMISQTPQVWLDHQTYPTRDGLLLNWDAVEDLFPPGLLDDMFTAYEGLVRSLASGDWDKPASLPLPAAQAAVRTAVNATAAPVEAQHLHEAFFAHALAGPDCVALIAGNEILSRRTLAERALRIAGLLRGRGIRDGDVVGIALPKGAEQVAAVLGVAAAGATYLPVAWDQPAARTRRICLRAGAGLVLTRAEKLDFAGWPDGVTPVDLAEAAGVMPLPAPVSGDPERSAYIIFTSGSTGEPKGVEVSHAAAWNTVASINDRLGAGSGDRILALSALEFDLSVYDIFGPLSAGGAIVTIDESQRRDPDAWIDLVRRHRVTLWNSVPALLEMTTVAATEGTPLASLRAALISGDWIPLDLPDRLRRVSGPGVRFVALGGATEAAIWSNAIEVTEVPAHWPSIPYGLPLPNQQFRVVDAQGRDCPDLVPGELWIGGDGLARGYKGAPELTAERFVAADGGRWYRTGDRGRYWHDGTLEFLGRLDHQIKVRGHRIELGEIEAALERHPAVTRAVAAVVGHGTDRTLGACVALSAPAADGEILAFAQGQLPDHMVPRRLAFVDALPLTTNGKIDRTAIGALLDLQPPPGADGGSPPQGPIETAVAVLWNEALGTTAARRDDSFFQLGGNSLQAARLAASIARTFGVSLPLRAFLGRPTIAGVAGLIELDVARLGAVEEGTV